MVWFGLEAKLRVGGGLSKRMASGQYSRLSKDKQYERHYLLSDWKVEAQVQRVLGTVIYGDTFLKHNNASYIYIYIYI